MLKLIPRYQKGSNKYAKYGNNYITFDKAYNNWARQNPTVKLNGVSVKTSDLKDYMYTLAEHESSFDANRKPVKGSKYSGYFQIENSAGQNPFNALVNHMNKRLSRLTVDDLQRAKSKRISDAAILAKVHNQGDNFVNWLWGGQDTADGAGTLISQYGNDWAPNLNILSKVITQKALRPGQYAILQKRQSYETYAPLVRYPGVTVDKTAGVLQKEYKRHYPKRKDPANPWVGDTVWVPQVFKLGGLVSKFLIDDSNKE